MGRLAKAPLQEVIFEVRWEVSVDPASGQAHDDSFALASGALKAYVKDKFPHVDARLPFYELAPQAFLYQAALQFRAEPGSRPLLQLGPGVFTVNDTDKDYDWDTSFNPTLEYGLSKLEEAYEGPLPYNYVGLRYIDSVKVKDYDFKDWASFIPANLNFSFSNQFDSGMIPKDVAFQQLFDLPDGGQLHLQIGSAKDSDGNVRLLWQTALIRTGTFTRTELISWAQEAHRKSSELFKAVCKPHFYASFL